jgi:hypothetical protein
MFRRAGVDSRGPARDAAADPQGDGTQSFGAGDADTGREARGEIKREETLRAFVQRILEHEAGSRRRARDSAELPSVLVCRKLRPPLVDIMGRSGFRLLMVRAAAKAGAESQVVVDDDGYVNALHPSDQALIVDVLIAFIDLTAEIMGQNLALRLVRNAWPEVGAPARRPWPTRSCSPMLHRDAGSCT